MSTLRLVKTQAPRRKEFGLRCGVFAPAHSRSPVASSSWRSLHGVLEALKVRGHEVMFFEQDLATRTIRGEGFVGPRPHFDIVLQWVSDVQHAPRASQLRPYGTVVALWSNQMPSSPNEQIRRQLEPYDVLFVSGGNVGDSWRDQGWGVPLQVTIEPAVDPQPLPKPSSRSPLRADLGFWGVRDRENEAYVREFLFEPAQRLPAKSFVVIGRGWGRVPTPAAVRAFESSSTEDPATLGRTCLSVLAPRSTMEASLEAAMAGTCLLASATENLSAYLAPGVEMLQARDGEEVAAVLSALSPERAKDIGYAARRRVLSRHTYAHRAELLEAVFEDCRAQVFHQAAAVRGK